MNVVRTLKGTAMPDAHLSKHGEWVYPQLYYKAGKQISKKKLLEQIYNNPLVQEAIQVDPHVGRLIEQANQQRCVCGYSWAKELYDRYKPQIECLVGWRSPYPKLRTMKHYDAVYDAIYTLLPADDVDLYPEGIMSNGMYSPNLQSKYGREYP